MDEAQRRRHWDRAYGEGDTTRSWYQEQARTSLELIERAAAGGDASVVDVGGGASTLADGLLAGGFGDVTVLDVSPSAIEVARARLGQLSERVTWVVADLLTWSPGREFDLWHDRAVLHFLVEPHERDRYRRVLLAATAPGSSAVVGVFGPDGPTQCSGLPVRRYDEVELAELLGEAFVIDESSLREHQTPNGASQQFLWARATRVG